MSLYTCAICEGPHHTVDCNLRDSFGASSGWQCPNCGSAHAPDVKTCPQTAATSHNFRQCQACDQWYTGIHDCPIVKTAQIDWDERMRYWLT